MVAIGIASIPHFARLIRGGTLQVMKTEYVIAARAAGRGRSRSRCGMFCPTSAVSSSCRRRSFAIAVLAEAALSFLGLGTPPPPRPGAGCCRRARSCCSSAPRLAVFPGIAIAVAVLGFNLLGDGLRDRFDPKLEDRR